MKSNLVIALLLCLLSAPAWSVAPQKMILTNQFGEQSFNWVQGTYLPLPGTTSHVVMFSGTTITPTAATGVNVAGTGSLYIGRNPASYGSAKLFINFGTITAPAWAKIGP